MATLSLKLAQQALRCFPESFEHRVLFALREKIHGKRLSVVRSAQPVVTGDEYSLEPADRLNCIFVHIPKCAGVSVSRALFGCLGGGHTSLEDYQRIYSPREYAGKYKFTIVRNPWDRLVSAFLFLRAGGFNEEDRLFANDHLQAFDSFETFVAQWVNSKNIMQYPHFYPQLSFISVNRRPPKLDFIGRFEQLEADFAKIARRLGIETKLPAENRTHRNRDYRDYYNAETMQIVGDVYRADIATLGYSF